MCAALANVLRKRGIVSQLFADARGQPDPGARAITELIARRKVRSFMVIPPLCEKKKTPTWGSPCGAKSAGSFGVWLPYFGQR
jgi:hypothetical protein